jgi:hypothetical protein
MMDSNGKQLVGDNNRNSVTDIGKYHLLYTQDKFNMAYIEISNLNIAGSDLFAGTDSFLTELQDTDTTQIMGGKGKSGKGGYGYGGKSGKGGYGYGGKSGGYGYGGHGGYGGYGGCGYPSD